MVTAYLPTYLEQVLKLDATTTSVLITCVMAIMIPLALMFGKLADKIGEKRISNWYWWANIIQYHRIYVITFTMICCNSNRYIYIRFIINLRSDNARVVTNDTVI